MLALNSSRYRLRQENAAYAALVPQGSSILDAGAGLAPYKNLSQHTQYESSDFEQVNKVSPSTYVCDLKSIPVEDCRFEWLEGYIGTVGCMSRYFPWKLNNLHSGIIGYMLSPIVVLLKLSFAACSILFHRLETSHKYKQRSHPKNYLIIASKAGYEPYEIYRQRFLHANNRCAE